MKILMTIAHYYNPIRNFDSEKFGDATMYSSLSYDGTARIEALRTSIWNMRMMFGERNSLLNGESYYKTVKANENFNTKLDIVICCIDNKNLINSLGLPPRYYEVRRADCNPLQLGFTCQKVLRERLGDYDIYAFSEDDIIYNDPLFFEKVRWFTETFGDHRVLFPNRFDAFIYGGPDKQYTYAPLDNWIKGIDREEVSAEVFGKTINFTANSDLHAGSFALTAAQMERWVNSDNFLDLDMRLVGPLESAATLGIAKNFKIFRPAFENASFLETRHFVPRCSPAED